MTRSRRLLLAAVAAVALAGSLPATASAVFPGLNGKVAFARLQSSSLGVAALSARSGDLQSEQFFITSSGRIFSMDPSGANQVGLTSGATDFVPAWSPDGRFIVFERQAILPSLTLELWVMNADGSGLRQLTSGNIDSRPSFSADGSKVYFVRSGAIWVIGVDGSNPHALFTPPALRVYSGPVASPDGSRIAFEDDPLTLIGPAQIVIANADGSGTPSPLPGQSSPATAASESNGSPDWSPDSSRIVFNKSSFATSASAIWVVNVDGSNLHALTTSTTNQIDSAPVFSPDGQQIAFTRGPGTAILAFTVPTGPQSVWEMNADGSNLHQVTATGTSTSDVTPDWQPLPNLLSAAQAPGCSRTGAITVTATDQSGFRSPPTKVDYQIDGGPVQSAPVSNGSATIVVPEGKHTLSSWAENASGQQEQTHHDLAVTVDSTAPHLTLAFDQHRATFVRGERATITIRATDAGGSGLVRNPSRRHRRISTARLGTHRLRFTATDACGNSTTKSLRYRVVRAVVHHHHPRFTG